MRDWFKKWFSSDEYLRVYAHRNKKDAENLINLILKNVSIPHNAKILDAACGAGRHSILLSQMGYNVTAFDLSKSLLKIGMQNCCELKTDVKFVCADIRNAHFKSHFNLVLNMFTSFGYFQTDSENFRFFVNARSFLSEGGFIVVDYFNKEFLTRNLISETKKVINKNTIIERREIKNGFVIKDILIRKDGEEKLFHEMVKLYSYEDIMSKFIQFGYRPTKIFGDYDGNEFAKDSSERLIVIFIRRIVPTK